MNKITLTKQVVSNGITYLIPADISENGCDIRMPVTRAFLSWDEMCDVEALAETFQCETVRMFRALVAHLGEIFVNTELYKRLL